MNCIFCQIVAREAPAHIIYEDAKTLAFLDHRPQARGHTQLIPKEHFRWVYDITYFDEFFTTARYLTRGIIPVLKASSVTWATYGGEVPHAHLWIVPRYKNSPAFYEGGGKASHELAETQELLSRALQKNSYYISPTK